MAKKRKQKTNSKPKGSYEPEDIPVDYDDPKQLEAATRKAFQYLKRKGNNVDMIEWPGFLHEIHNGNKVSKGDEVIDSMIQFILG